MHAPAVLSPHDTVMCRQVTERLRQLPGVSAIPRDDALKKQHAESRIWNETWLAAFFHKPCNHELFVRQSLNMEGELMLPGHAP